MVLVLSIVLYIVQSEIMLLGLRSIAIIETTVDLCKSEFYHKRTEERGKDS
jgi:hypothetical protein